MKITSFEIYNYKPFLYCGNSYIKADIVSNTFICIGSNGSGKSSLLRELTPLPSIKTDYLKDGRKILHIEHNNNQYIISSDFSNTKHTHSFIKNGNELNESGNYNIQIDLCRQEFNLIPLINDIINFNIKISELPNTKRKELFLKLYPSDLSFINEYYRNVQSKIRAHKLYIKKLYESKEEITSKLSAVSNIEKLKEQKQVLTKSSNFLDKLIFVIDNEIVKLESSINIEYLEFDIEDFNKFIIKFIQMYNKQKIKNIDGLKNKISNLSFQIKTYTDNNTQLLESIDNIKEHISECENYLNELESDDLNTLKKSYNEFSNECKKLKQQINFDICFLKSQDEIDAFEKILNEIFSLIDFNNENIYLSIDNYKRCEMCFKEYSMIKKELSERLNTCKNEISEITDRYKKEKSLSYPSECKLHCKLKLNKEYVLNQLKKKLQTYKDKYTSLYQKYQKCEKVLNGLKKYLWYDSTVYKKISYFERILQQYQWSNYALNGLRPITVLNFHKHELRNKLIDILENSKNYITYKQYQDKLDVLKIKIEQIEKLNKPNKKYIIETLKKRNNELKQLTSKYHENAKYIESLKQLVDIYDNIDSQYKQFVERVNLFIQHYNTKLENEAINFYKAILSDCEYIRNCINKDLIKIDENLEMYNSLNNQLKELQNMIKREESEYEKMTYLEKALSPNSGIPHIYLVQYINFLINEVNSYLKKVWGYDMLLKHFDKNIPIDFNFKLKINDGEIKDISMASKGQKEVIDLTWILVLYIQKKLQSYPLKLDEPDSGLSEGNRVRLLGLLSGLMNNNSIGQLIFVNHHPSLYASFKECQTLCLNSEDIVVPSDYNQNIMIR